MSKPVKPTPIKPEPVKPVPEAPQKQSAKTLSNSLRLKSPQGVKRKQNVANILERLPFLRQLNVLQNQLLSVTPVWQKWLNQENNQSIRQYATLANLDEETLVIKCTQTSVATLIKHQQSSLLEHLHKSGFEQIQTIRIQMRLENSNSLDTPNQKSLSDENQSTSSSDSKWKRPSESSLKSIEATTSTIKNEQLAASLQRLTDTLKKAT